MARLVLIGLPGAGKTTLAKVLAERWSCDAIDTDDLVAARVGEPAATYLRERGEAAFRVHELESLREALGLDAVVATGAGVVTTVAARELLGRELTVWLDADDETLLERVREGERPLLGDDHRRALEELRTRRAALYRSSARVRVDATGTIDEVLQRALEQLDRVGS